MMKLAAEQFALPACVFRQAQQPGGRGLCLEAEKTRSQKMLENAQTPTRQAHALLGSISLTRLTIDYLNFF